MFIFIPKIIQQFRLKISREKNAFLANQRLDKKKIAIQKKDEKRGRLNSKVADKNLKRSKYRN